VYNEGAFLEDEFCTVGGLAGYNGIVFPYEGDDSNSKAIWRLVEERLLRLGD
jgi:hypothetical protein